MIYLDHAATSPPRREVLEAMWPYLSEVFANPSSVHEPGRRARAGLEQARETVAEVLACRPGEVIFTSGGTEADNLAIQGMAFARPRGTHIVVSAIEHKAVLQTARWLRDRHGFSLDVVPVDANGIVDLDFIGRVLRPDTTLVSVMYANNEVGSVQPVSKIVERCASFDVPLHTDAVQAVGHLPVAVDTLGVAAMSISAHKFGGPRGTGALYVDGGLALVSIQHGGGQERGRRSGTSDVAGAVGLATALRLAEADRLQAGERAKEMRDALITGVLAHVPGARLTGDRHQRLTNHASFCVAGVNGEALLQELEIEGVVCSSGSACSAESEEASEVLLAMGIDQDLARTAVRFSFGSDFTAEHVKRVIAAMTRAVERLQRLGSLR